MRPMAAVATQDAMVNHTTHGLRLRRASETAPSSGTDAAMSSEEIDAAHMVALLEAPRSTTSHDAKYNDAMFIDQMVFAKSYVAQLQRSRAGARSVTTIASGAVTAGT